MIAEKPSHIRRRSARAFALQVLYEVDVAEHDLDHTVRWLQQEASLPEDALSYAMKLVRGVIENRQAIDVLIHRFAPAWPVHLLSVVDRNILRLALYEVGFEESVPHKAAINEAVELAKTFGSESSSRFVNGVLGTVMENWQGALSPP